MRYVLADEGRSRAMKRVYGAVLRVLDEEDLESLRSAGAPVDEYTQEAEMIADRLEG
jgi:hypothetical protein